MRRIRDRFGWLLPTFCIHRVSWFIVDCRSWQFSLTPLLCFADYARFQSDLSSPFQYYIYTQNQTTYDANRLFFKYFSVRSPSRVYSLFRSRRNYALTFVSLAGQWLRQRSEYFYGSGQYLQYWCAIRSCALYNGNRNIHSGRSSHVTLAVVLSLSHCDQYASVFQ